MTCREFIEFLQDYCEGRLSAEEKQRFDDHLAECPACVTYMESYLKAVDLARVTARQPLPEDVPEELVRAILDSRKA